jgi:hypothetical protein
MNAARIDYKLERWHYGLVDCTAVRIRAGAATKPFRKVRDALHKGQQWWIS